MTNGQTMHTLPGASKFPTTRWTLVVAAGDPQRKEARSAIACSLQLGIFGLGLFENRDAGIGVLPEREERIVCTFCLALVS